MLMLQPTGWNRQSAHQSLSKSLFTSSRIHSSSIQCSAQPQPNTTPVCRCQCSRIVLQYSPTYTHTCAHTQCAHTGSLQKDPAAAAAAAAAAPCPLHSSSVSQHCSSRGKQLSQSVLQGVGKRFPGKKKGRKNTADKNPENHSVPALWPGFCCQLIISVTRKKHISHDGRRRNRFIF